MDTQNKQIINQNVRTPYEHASALIDEAKDYKEGLDERYKHSKERMKAEKDLVDDRLHNFEEQMKAEKEQIDMRLDAAKEDAKEAKHRIDARIDDAKERAKMEKERLEERLETSKDRIKAEKENVGEYISEVKDERKEMKREIKAESKKVREDIDAYADRFEDGLDQVKGDLEYQRDVPSDTKFMRSNVKGTVNEIDEVWIAQTPSGKTIVGETIIRTPANERENQEETINKYGERIDIHTEKAKEHIDNEVGRAADMMQDKVNKIDADKRKK